MRKTHCEWADNACQLAAKGPKRTSANDPDMYVRKILATLISESKTQEELLKLEERSRIKTTIVQ